MKLLIEKDVEIPMRDGVILRADLYRPDDGEKHPALVFRSPYEKETLDRRWGQLSPVGFAKAGYVVVYQDVRGTGTSDGDFSFFFDQGDEIAEFHLDCVGGGGDGEKVVEQGGDDQCPDHQGDQPHDIGGVLLAAGILFIIVV